MVKTNFPKFFNTNAQTAKDIMVAFANNKKKFYSVYSESDYFLEFFKEAFNRYIGNRNPQLYESKDLLQKLFPETETKRGSRGGKSIKMRMSSKTKRAHKAKQWKTANHLVRVRNSRRKRKHNLTKKTS